MNGYRKTGLWPVDRYIFTDDDFAAFMVTERPETIQLEKPTAEETEHFSVSSTHAAKPAIPKQTPGYNEYEGRVKSNAHMLVEGERNDLQ
jgi:hypothetical protein